MNVLKPHQKSAVLTLVQNNVSQHEIGRKTGVDRKTIRKLVRAALDVGLEDGRTLRVDTTVVETDIHHPTDSTLLWDSVRVITRLVGRLNELLPQGVGGFPNRTRRARRRMQEIQRLTPTQRQRRQLRKYRDLIRTTEEVLLKAREVLNNQQSSRD